MADPRIEKFSKTICNCLDVVEEDFVLIWGNDLAAPLVLELQREILKRGGSPEIRINLEQMRYNLLKYGRKKHFQHFPPGLGKEIELATKFVSIDSIMNPSGMKGVREENFLLWQQTLEPYHRRLEFIPTVVTIYPNVHYANKADMSLHEYKDFFFRAVSVDLEKLTQKYSAMEQLLSRGNQFCLRTSNSDLSFELGDRHFTMNSLLVNLPAGEIYCAPKENTVNGHIRFEHPATYQGKVFRNLFLEFKDGIVINFDSDTEKRELEMMLNTDDGARKIGEFGFGVNPCIEKLTNDILFDEKVMGTIHIALGDALPEVGGTNRSMLHFDMVKDMRGDGEILMDNRVVYREGQFCTY